MRHLLNLNKFTFLLFFLIIFFYISSASAQDLQYPGLIDGGDIPIALDSSNKYAIVSKNVTFKIKNISNESIYFLGFNLSQVTPYQNNGFVSKSKRYLRAILRKIFVK